MPIDYNELKRLLAEELSEAEPGHDIITSVTAKLLNKSPSEVTPDERYRIKTLAFPILYGSPKMLRKE